MQSLPFQKLLRKFRDEKDENAHVYPLSTIDISNNAPLPKTTIFTEPSVLEYDSIYETEEPTELKTNELKTNELKTNECFYSDGILGNIYNIQNCDKYWLLSFCIAVQFRKSFTNEIRCFVMGYNSNMFIDGLHHYCSYSKFGKVVQTGLKWMGMGFDAHKFEQKFEINQGYILHGFVQDDICSRDNLAHVKHQVEIKLGNINMLYNNVMPIDCRILLSAASLIMTSMPTGIFISKIPDPVKWNANFINYLLLFSLLFNQTTVCRFPVSTKNKDKNNGYSLLSFQYFLVCHDRKRILHKTTAYRKILTYMKKCENNDSLNFVESISENPDVEQWKIHVKSIKEQYIQADQQDNPQLHINEIFDKIKDVIGVNDHFVP
jgi:hypothetical protein